MKRLVAVSISLWLFVAAGDATADGSDSDGSATVETVPEAVRVTVVRSGGEDRVTAVNGSGGGREGCSWSLVYVPALEDAPYGMDPGPQPDPEARFALLLCDGAIVGPIWVAPSDIVDLDALARDVAERYVEDVLVPTVGIGVNPGAHGLVGLPSWFWVEGFSGQVAAPPISAFGLTIEVRMSAASVTWDFGDGTVERGDLGRAYPEESSVQHPYRHHGTYDIEAAIGLIPEYRVDGGPWLGLPNLAAVASTQHEVQQRQAVITRT